MVGWQAHGAAASGRERWRQPATLDRAHSAITPTIFTLCYYSYYIHPDTRCAQRHAVAGAGGSPLDTSAYLRRPTSSADCNPLTSHARALRSAMWSRALAENPRELDVLTGYASLHYHVYGDHAKAEELFKDALRVQPGVCGGGGGGGWRGGVRVGIIGR